MSKFRVRMKLTGLEIEIDGSRDDAAAITASIGQQMANLLQPVDSIIDGAPLQPNLPGLETTPQTNVGKKSRKRRAPTASTNEGAEVIAIDFQHAPEKYGNPQQGWKTAEKSMWLLYVLKEAANVGEVSGRALSETFNKHFRQSGTITVSNTNRDLGRLKGEKPPALGEDASKNPPNWYLTDDGRKRAQMLVAQALGKAED